MSKPTEESFLKDVSEHKLVIKLDQGEYRHLRFGKPDGSTCMYFEIITGPGFLLYRGDMGTYEFERVQDMFEFFRGDKPELQINPYYWSEKIQAADRQGRSGSVFEFSQESFERRVRDSAKGFIENGGLGFFDEDEADEDEKEAYQEQLDTFNDDIDRLVELEYNAEEEAHGRLREWDFEAETTDGNRITAEDVFGQDTWEWDLSDYTYRYIWCCYAIVWGIKQYDAAKE